MVTHPVDNYGVLLQHKKVRTDTVERGTGNIEQVLNFKSEP
jgi:hypothetical protein